MKLKLKKEDAKKVIEAYYKKHKQFEGCAIFTPSKIISNLSILGKNVPIERDIEDKAVLEVLQEMLKEDGYEVSSINHHNDFELDVLENKQIKNLKVYKGMLIVVDMVNGFVKKGALADTEIEKIVPRQIELIKEAKAKEDLVVFIKDTHEEDSVEHNRFRDEEGNIVKHCVRKTGEELVIDELREFENSKDTLSILKNSTSYMEALEFRMLVMEATNIERVDVVGCCTDICVFNGSMGLANYYDQWNRDVDIRVHTDAIATFLEADRQDYVEASKLLMKQQGIQLVKKRK